MKTTHTPPAGANSLAALLTQEQAAEVLGVQVRTLESWRARGSYKLPFVRIGPRIVRYRLSDLHKFIDGQTVQPATV